ncbi:MAG: pentapeptide repeat-containing protein, partial [Chloroflexia bacterium]
FSGANLSGVNLRQADLSETNLSGADLSHADLSEANLVGADLTGADLSHADLSEANLVGADLTGADLTGAILDQATLWDVTGGSEALWDQASSLIRAHVNRLPEILSAVEAACSGEGVPGTRSYSGGIGEHPLVVAFEENTLSQEDYLSLWGQISEIDRWNDRLNGSWLPTAIRFTELVACVRAEAVVVETCGPYYTPDGRRAPDITRYRVRVTMTVREAATGRVVARRSFLGSEPRTCGMRESYGTTSIWGSNVAFEDVRDWLGSLAYVPPDLAGLERWRTVIEERFVVNRNRWPIGSLWKGEHWSENTAEIADGVYRWHGKARRDVVSWVHPEVADLYDLYLSVDVRQVAGPADAQGGIVFRLSDDGYYRFSLTAASQRYLLERWYKEEWTTLAEGTATAAIRKEGWNTIQAAVVGAHLTIWVNGELVATAEDFARIKGKAGVTVGFFSPGDEGTFEFDNWILRVPER